MREWVKEARSALARWISPPSEITGKESLEREIILALSDSLKEEDAFRLILQIRKQGTTIETDVRTSNYIEVEPEHVGRLH